MFRGLLLTLSLMAFSLSCSAAEEPASPQYVAGVHYDLITPKTWTADIPNDPGLRGVQFYTQWMAVNLFATPRVFQWTNAGDGIIGER